MENRIRAINNIIDQLAIIRHSIEQHQIIKDYSRNVLGENWFRDMFNDVYDCNFKNANSKNSNTPYIDLIDEGKKLAYQITSTKSREKIEKTLQVLNKPKYYNYQIKIFYLLGKPSLSEKIKNEINTKFNINIVSCLEDYDDLVKAINNLNETKIIELNDKYFKSLVSVNKNINTDNNINININMADPKQNKVKNKSYVSKENLIKIPLKEISLITAILIALVYVFFPSLIRPSLTTSQMLLAALQQGADKNCKITAQANQLGYSLDKDNLALTLNSSRSGYLSVFTLGSSSELYQIFPNSYDSNNLIEPNILITLPKPDTGWILSARKPAGENHLFIVVADSKNLFQVFNIPNDQPNRKTQNTTFTLIKQINTVLQACAKNKTCPNYCITTMTVSEL